MEDASSRQLSILTEFAIGGAAGLLDCLLFHWLDTWKVRRQDGRPFLMDLASGRPLQQRTPTAVLRSLYAGFSTNVSLKLPYMASMFAFHELNSWLLHEPGSTSGRDASNVADTGITKRLLSAALVGVEVSVLLSPLEMIRIQGQNCGKGGLLSSLLAVAATAPPHSGIRGYMPVFSRGLTATFNREIKYCVGQFFLCRHIADSFAKRTCTTDDSLGDAVAPVAAQVAGTCVGGFACTIISHPDDVIKTRMQTHLAGSKLHEVYGSYTKTGLSILRSGGVSALFHGAAIRCALRVPLGLTVIELSSHALRRQWLEMQQVD